MIRLAMIRLALLLGALLLLGGRPGKAGGDLLTRRTPSQKLRGTPLDRGKRSNPPENLPRQVNGILNRSASFSLELPSTKKVARTEWTFRAGSGPEILIAEFKDGKLQRLNTSDRFGPRLEMASETTLHIRALEKEDNCTLEGRVVFASGEVQKQIFHLSVFEPVPDPQIRHNLTSKMPEACNVTLQCLGSGKGGIDVSWKRGDQFDVLEGGPNWYQLSAEGTELHLSWQPTSSDSTFTCLLSNPADEKNVSFDLTKICTVRDDRHPRKMWIFAPVVMFSILVAGLGICLRKKWLSPAAVPLKEPEKGGSTELPYAELQKSRSPPEGHENKVNAGKF